MNAFTSKKTIAGASAIAVAGLVTAGFAAPAFADHEGTTTSTRDTSTVTEGPLTNDLLDDITSDTTFADLLDGSVDGIVSDITGGDLTGSIGVDGLLGDITGGDITGGDLTGGDTAVGSIGGDTAIGNGDISNESPVIVAPEVGDIGSGNAIGSGNDTSIDLGDAVDVNDLVDSTVGDLVDSTVDDVIDSTVDSVDLDGLVDDITGDLDLGLSDLFDE